MDDFRDWYWSSCGCLDTGQTDLPRQDEVPDWFGGIQQFREYHRGRVDEKKIAAFIEEYD